MILMLWSGRGFASLRSPENRPGDEVITVVLKMMNGVGRNKQHIAEATSSPLAFYDEISTSSHDNIDLILVMRALQIFSFWGKDKNGHAAMPQR